MTSMRIAILLALMAAVGCGESERLQFAPLTTPTATPPLTATTTRTATPTVTPRSTATVTSTPWATMTPTGGTPAPGPFIGFIGLLRADDTLLSPADVDAQGRPVYERVTGSGFVLVIDVRSGIDNAPIGLSAFSYYPTDPSVQPDLQVEVSRDLGNGSAAVCDNTPGDFGGVPGIDPPDFDTTREISDALNDLGCRFDDGTGTPQGRDSRVACVLFPDGQYNFVDPLAAVEFCASISRAISFPQGDTVVTARVRDIHGVTGPAQQIVVRVTGS